MWVREDGKNRANKFCWNDSLPGCSFWYLTLFVHLFMFLVLQAYCLFYAVSEVSGQHPASRSNTSLGSSAMIPVPIQDCSEWKSLGKKKSFFFSETKFCRSSTSLFTAESLSQTGCIGIWGVVNKLPWSLDFEISGVLFWIKILSLTLQPNQSIQQHPRNLKCRKWTRNCLPRLWFCLLDLGHWRGRQGEEAMNLRKLVIRVNEPCNVWESICQPWEKDEPQNILSTQRLLQV